MRVITDLTKLENNCKNNIPKGLGMVMHTFNSKVLEAEVDGHLWVQGQPDLHSDF